MLDIELSYQLLNLELWNIDLLHVTPIYSTQNSNDNLIELEDTCERRIDRAEESGESRQRRSDSRDHLRSTSQTLSQV